MNDEPTPPEETPDRNFARKLLRWAWYTLAGVVLLCAATLAGVRFLLPELGHYRPQIETWLSRVTEQQVEIGAIDARWRGWTPVFRIKDVRLGGSAEPPGATPDLSIRLADLAFSIDPMDLVRSGAFLPRNISASGASLVVVQRPDGTFAVGDVGEFAPAAPTGSDGLARWILGQAKISLFSSRIFWIDEGRARPPVPLDGVTLHLEHVGDRHRITGSFEPSATGRIDFAMEMTGASFTSSWSGSAYVAVHDVDISRLGLDAGHTATGDFSGVISATAWSTWQGGRPVEAEGTIHAQSPGWVHHGRWRGFDEVSAAFKVERTPLGWTLAARDIEVATPRGSWPPSSAEATWTPPRDGNDGAVVVSAQFARIEDLVALVGPSDDASVKPMLKALTDADPHGAIENFHVSLPITDRVELERVRTNGRFTDLRIGSEAAPVSVDTASGRFEANEQGLVADVISGRLLANVPDWLAQPLQGERLAGTFVALSTPQGMRLRFEGASIATPVGTITADGVILAPRGESDPELDITLSLGPSQIAAVRSLPANRLVPDALSRWLESAIPFGDMHDLRLVYRGRISEATFREGTAELEASAVLVVPVVSYAPGWPEIAHLAATVQFDGRRFDARVGSGRIMKSAIREATVTIEDVTAEVPAIRVEGRIEGASANAVRFLAESPLRTRFPTMVDSVTMHGDSTIDLDLTIPLKGRDRSISAAGSISLDDNRIEAPVLRRGLVAVNGKVAFQGSEVTSDGITATWLGEPIHAVIGAPPDASHATRLSASGRLTRRLLAAYLQDAGLLEVPTPSDSPLLARIRGDTTWTAVFDIPKVGSGSPTTLHFTSDLTGLSLDLPPPLGKTSGSALALRIARRTTPGVDRITEVHVGGVASAVLRLVREGGRFGLDRGAIRIGDDRAELPDTPGITVHAAVPVFDSGGWHALIDDMDALNTPSVDGARFGSVREVSIDAGSMLALGKTYPETRIHAARGPEGGWRLDLAGQDLEGVVRLPRDLRTEPVSLDFERFVVEPDTADVADTDDESTRLDPRALPALSFSARHFVLGDYDLGRVSFTAAPSEHGLEIERAEVLADTFQGEATGHWRVDGTEHVTDLVMRMYRINLGRTLDSLGFGGNAVAEGSTDISVRGSWQGTPADFELERLTGIMHFLSTDGRLSKFEPGVTGHVLGLLTITSLPRRLILDFGDLFDDGLAYDRIDGRFAIENGNAYTDDLYMESDTARVEVVGRTGLVSKDYDQLVTVIPKISSSLPLVPIWIAQKILNRNVFDKAFAYQYTITGPWDEPAVELVKTESRESLDSQ